VEQPGHIRHLAGKPPGEDDGANRGSSPWWEAIAALGLGDGGLEDGGRDAVLVEEQRQGGRGVVQAVERGEAGDEPQDHL
jgi:hypothetical protein